MSEEKKTSGIVIAAFVVSLIAFLMGLVPLVGWLLVITGTILYIVALTKKEKGGFMITSVILLSLTWITKILISFALVSFFTSVDEELEKIEDIDTTDLIADAEGDVQASLYEVNESVPADGAEVTVAGFETKDKVGNDLLNKEVSEGGVFAVIQYKVKNTSDEPMTSWSYPDIQLMDEKGVAYDADIEASGYYAGENEEYNEKMLSDLNPGITTNGAYVFEVSKELFDQGEWFVLIDGEHKVNIK
ncbi:DUF4352 domain-containing protein (plasmid) [Pontibacillus sp. ALD_SL1]|uniref:DUF4352 domain-containing protein n=1 Tax=Pontibacillus sp. ALD_SL1 TaxID=2777185 RepID=UPI001A95F63F|nr:DUF4352 domain-containing protein [Pontibacillus sp. ALD_SL1]QST02459.1 DUF4352 domain-containing protein [Pontibacillus sp. ALD_SL1]